MAAPAIYSIRPGIPFVDALAAGILACHGEEPMALARVRVLLPNRRAGRALTLAFLRRNGGRPMLLPRMLPVGDLDEDELAFVEADAMEGADVDSLPPAMPPLARLLTLARLVKALRQPTPPDDLALRLARELARLIDQVHVERLAMADLARLVPDELAAHWQLTLEFLTALTGRWRDLLAAQGALDPADRRNRLLAAQARAWTERPPAEPIIAAGSTGSIPATADLIAVVATLPAGAVVLPGLDVDAPAAAWEAILDDPGHPQFGMARLLRRLGVERGAVRPWLAPGIDGTPPERTMLLNEAMRPAAAADLAAARPRLSAAAVDGLARIDAPGLSEEARAIALIMRETLEEPGRTAALVTADRGLARRVAAELARWGIEVDDSAGEPLAGTPPAVFLRLIADLLASELAPVPLLALLKHPLAAVGFSAADCRRRVRRLELTARRGERPVPGIEGLRAVAVDDASLRALIVALEEAMAPLLACKDAAAGGVAPLADWLAAHVAAAEALAATPAEAGAARLWAGEAGEALAGFIAELADTGGEPTLIGAADYPAVFDELLSGRVVRPRYGRHPRLQIWGTLEARLQHADRMVLGGLNEGSWPPEAPASPWMSRPMMNAFGLPLPERRIGLSAHDFVQACSAPQVWLTRAARVAGAPTVPSRWLLRLEALLDGPFADAVTARGARWLHWQEALDRPTAEARQRRPAPCPPLHVRPRNLSVTEIETWARDPYALYAKKILELEALAPIDPDPDAADFGRFVHQALDDFIRETPGDLADDALAHLLACGERAFGNMPRGAAVRAFWWPRFQQIARWFIGEERRRRRDRLGSVTEVKGLLVLETVSPPFTVRARADRIDQLKDGSLVTIDYKTGAPPSRREVGAGFAPQLPLEALIAMHGGFEGIPAGNVAALQYWQLKAVGSEITSLEGGTGETKLPPPADLAAQARRELETRIAAFDDPSTPYMPRPRPRYAPAYSDYEHLARIKEWSVVGGEDGDEGGSGDGG